MPRPRDPDPAYLSSNLGSGYVDWRAPLGLFSLFHIMQPYFLLPFEMYDARWDELSQSFLCGPRDDSIFGYLFRNACYGQMFDGGIA
jgi:hypothetical protein